MKRSRLHKFGAAFLVLGLVGVTATFFNSSRFNPDPSGDQSFIARAQQKSAPGIKVSVSVLGAGESLDRLDALDGSSSFQKKDSTEQETPGIAAYVRRA
ncbi:MAG: hypothetical protein WA652_11930 [Xanthobacteraceae bacterium]